MNRYLGSVSRFRRSGAISAGALILGGCSIINSFDEVAPEETASTGGMGGESASGGSGAGGSTSGGTDMGGSSETGGTGTGGTEPVEAEPGLVLAMVQEPDFSEILYVLSPQDGSELAQDAAEYASAAYEPERDIWFFVRNNRLASARFDRITNEWTFLMEEGPEVLGVTDFTEQFFALNRRLALKVGTKLQVFDTDDPEDITFVDEVDYPVGLLWGAAGARKSIGGNVVILTKDCPGVGDCSIDLTSVSITDTVVQVTREESIITDYDNLAATARGNIRYDIASERLVALIPSTDTSGMTSVGKIANAYVFTPDSLIGDSDNPFPFQQPGNQIAAFAVDPCDSVAYTMGPLSFDLSVFSLSKTGDEIPLVENGIPGSRIVYEPFTRSLLIAEDGAQDFGLDAYSLTGTETVPDVERRVIDWSPPTLRPKFVAVETVDTLSAELCP